MAAAVDDGDDAASALVLADAAAAVDGAIPKTKVCLLLLLLLVVLSILLSLISLFPAGMAVVIALAPLALAKPNPEEGLVAPPKLNPAPKPVPLAAPNPENDAADPNTKAAALVVSVADVGAVIVSSSSWVEGVDEGSPTAAAATVADTADAADTAAVVVAVNVTAANGLLLAAFGGASLLVVLSTIGAAVAEFAAAGAGAVTVAAGRRTFTILRCAKTCAEARANDVPLLLSLSLSLSSSDSSPCAAASRW